MIEEKSRREVLREKAKACGFDRIYIDIKQSGTDHSFIEFYGLKCGNTASVTGSIPYLLSREPEYEDAVEMAIDTIELLEKERYVKICDEGR